MSHPEHHSPLIASLGMRAHKGGAVVVCVAMVEGAPRVLLSATLQTFANGDRLSFEPYTVAADMARNSRGGIADEAAAIVAEGRRRQGQLATDGLKAMLHSLEAEGRKPVMAALLVNRAGWITDLLSYSLAWKEHVPVAEALAVRDALRFASSQCGEALAELDEKSLPDLATKTLGMSSTELATRLKALGALIGTPWRKEQKLACLSAWTVIARQL